MRITRRKLIELARDEALARAENGGLISAYLIGSVAHGDPLLGGTADIDMVLIHDEPPHRPREIVRLSHQVHFDIAHHHKQQYERPSELRTDPWLGPALCEPIFLHDPEHFFEWAQAAARGQYYRADHTHERSQGFLALARQQASLLPLSGRWERAFLTATLNAANSVASLYKFPVAGRRLVLALQQQARALDMLEVYGRFLKLIGADQLHEWSIADLYQPWTHAFDAAISLNHDEMLVDSRKDYYLKGFQALSDQGQQKAVLWPLFFTWERSIQALAQHADHERHQSAWQQALASIKLDEAHRSDREAALLEFIQLVDHRLVAWAEAHGA